MTEREAVVISAYTGISCCEFSPIHKYIEEIMDRPVFTHEMASKELFKKIKELSKPEFLKIVNEVKD